MVLVIGGAEAIAYTTLHTGIAGSGAGIGSFSYQFECTLEPDSVHVGETRSVGGVIIIRGSAPRRFKFHGGVSPVYDQVTLQWMLYFVGASGRSEGYARVDLLANEIRTGGKAFPLEQSGMARALGIDNPQSNCVFLDALFDFLNDCKSGDIPRPGHHPRRIEGPVEGDLVHVASGSMIRYPVVIWFGICLVLVVAACLLPRLSGGRSPRTDPSNGETA